MSNTKIGLKTRIVFKCDVCGDTKPTVDSNNEAVEWAKCCDVICRMTLLKKIVAIPREHYKDKE